MNARTFPTPKDVSHSIVFTSIEDMQSSIKLYDADAYHYEVLSRALALCQEQGQKTKVTILIRALKKMQKKMIAAEAVKVNEEEQ